MNEAAGQAGRRARLSAKSARFITNSFWQRQTEPPSRAKPEVTWHPPKPHGISLEIRSSWSWQVVRSGPRKSLVGPSAGIPAGTWARVRVCCSRTGKPYGRWLLQVRENRGLHLKAKLVTLSACDTGVGPVGQTGVANLVNAFIEAGADTFVSTLWELEDQTTGHLMAQFYLHLAKHERKIDALRAAKIELLDQGLPPYYWASFQVVGDPNGKL